MKPGPKPKPGARARHRRAVRKAMKLYRKRHRQQINARRNEANFRKKEIARRLSWRPDSEGFRVCQRGSVDKPLLMWLDAEGTLHREDTRSAEEVIEQWTRKHTTNPSESD